MVNLPLTVVNLPLTVVNVHLTRVRSSLNADGDKPQGKTGDASPGPMYTGSSSLNP